MEDKQYTTNQPVDHWRNQNKPRHKWKWKHDDPKPIGHRNSNSNGKGYSNTILPQETIKISNKQSNLTHEATIREEQAKPKANRRKDTRKIRADINEMETKNMIEKINETKSWLFENTKLIKL